MDNIMFLEGIASVFNHEDLQKDIIRPGALEDSVKLFNQKKHDIHFLLNHNTEKPIGKITKIKIDEDQCVFEAIIFSDLSYNKDLCFAICNGVYMGVSVGIIVNNKHFGNNVRYINKAQLLEISIVTIPANNKCRITKFQLQNKK